LELARDAAGRLAGGVNIAPRGAPARLRDGAGNQERNESMEEAAVEGTNWLAAIIVWIIVGGIAGWLASMIVKGGGMGLGGNIVLGIVGAVVAGWLLPAIGIGLGGGIIGAIISAMIGAIIVLLIISLIRRA
jgi:uncharacterized membrane protein YeaQ/YmgE (transglycosylase-associated protein family)